MTKSVKTARLSHTEEIELTRQLAEFANNGDQRKYKRTLDNLVTHNFGLVVKIVKKFPLKNASCSFDDLFQEGVAGLIHGIQKFDPSKGYRLSTYVYNWISVYVRRYYQNHGRTVRVPIHMADKHYKLNRQIEDLTTKLGRTPTTEEIYKVNGKADQILSSMRYVGSLNTALDSESELLLVVQAEDKTHELDTKHDADVLLNKVRKQVSSRDYTMLVRRFGLDGSEPLTLSECADMFKITRARVHQIEKSILQKMRDLAAA